MKKIINGKVYDTETAKEVGYWSNGANYGDFSWCAEKLHRKKTGEFFLHGEGGAMTRYSVPQGQNSWSGGERIMPLSYAEAKAWAEEHLDGDEYEAIFGEVVEDETRTTVTYSLAASTAEAIRRKAAELGISASEYIERMIAD